MRINLRCPYENKDEARALGARWDAARKCWYIVDVEDLTPFMRWIDRGASRAPTNAAPASRPKLTTSYRPDLACSCIALPWEDCDHSLERAEIESEAAMLEMLA